MRIRLSQYDDEYGSFERDDDYNVHEENELAQEEARERRESLVEEAPFYVNVYDVESRYGGPEEGGWYYDAGTLLESVPAQSHEEALVKAGELEEKYALDNAKRTPGRIRLNNPDDEIPDDWEPSSQAEDESFVHYEGEIKIYIQDRPGENFPTHRPHYE
jgi:hypothetical protein